MPESKILPSDFPLGRRFGMLVQLYFGALTKKLEKLDIERHYSILILLESSKGNCSQQYISDFLKVDKVSMVRMIDYLTKKGYIKRLVNPDDRREHHIVLTNKAYKMLPAIHKAIDELNAAATKGLSPEQVKFFYKSLDLLTNNLAEQPVHAVVVNFKKSKMLRK